MFGFKVQRPLDLIIGSIVWDLVLHVWLGVISFYVSSVVIPVILSLWLHAVLFKSWRYDETSDRH